MTNTPDANLKNEKEIVKAIYAALNEDKTASLRTVFDPDILRVEFEGTPSGGRFRGVEEVLEHFAKGRSTWAEGSCEPEQLIAAEDKVVALVHVKVRLQNGKEWLEGDVGDVFTFRNGKVTEMRSFMKKQDALIWAKAEMP